MKNLCLQPLDVAQQSQLAAILGSEFPNSSSGSVSGVSVASSSTSGIGSTRASSSASSKYEEDFKREEEVWWYSISYFLPPVLSCFFFFSVPFLYRFLWLVLFRYQPQMFNCESFPFFKMISKRFSNENFGCKYPWGHLIQVWFWTASHLVFLFSMRYWFEELRYFLPKPNLFCLFGLNV